MLHRHCKVPETPVFTAFLTGSSTIKLNKYSNFSGRVFDLQSEPFWDCHIVRNEFFCGKLLIVARIKRFKLVSFPKFKLAATLDFFLLFGPEVVGC